MNKTILYSALSFFGGAAVAALVTWKVVDKVCEEKYEALYQEEKKSLKEHFTVPRVELKKEKVEEKKEESQVHKRVPDKPSLSDYAKRIQEYTSYNKKDVPEVKLAKAYVIEPDEYGEDEDYEQQELTFYADGILADEDDTILDADEVLGKDSIAAMGKYEDDALHVKNEDRKVYYEVLVDERSYEKATGKELPHRNKDEEDE